MTTTKQCRKCLSEIPFQARRCGHCRARQPFDLLRLIPFDIAPWKKVVVLVLGTLLLVGALTPDSPPSPFNPATEKVTAARIFSRSLAERVPLKSPKTATYGRPAVAVDPKDPNHFRVASYVDSQNSYGGLMRAEWSLELRYTGDDTAAAIN